MLEVTGDSLNRRDTQTKIVFGRHCAPWTEEELSRLRELAAKPMVSSKTLERLIPGRSVKAAKKQLHKLRKKMGIVVAPAPITTFHFNQRITTLDPSDPGEPDSDLPRWRARAKASNAAMLEALSRAMAA